MLSDILSDTEADLIDEIDTLIDKLNISAKKAREESKRHRRNLDTMSYTVAEVSESFTQHIECYAAAATLEFVRDKLIELLNDHEGYTPKGVLV